ncbi:cobaltochelatase subunit CobN [Rhodoplanes sp. TEM]|uniref:Cobaltochelatase subunit CobN n=1 Tax=Rhodoplanes tepidamans TaxID=200616 RepID=A0ABT5J882_RHOTP|nr:MULTISPECIES: cobaltochelatase subunit CobN [Rhodoplanes]MDC7785867.1 cobaltochelatase subunit CobN [Rhodoplanes tepidamans]MDC7984979.1 cobaltochelatase subunit CobN [Rhodoplanes sp. TEM]MDQ0355516.1 cobaltochelatase CobN [Rhodoplanes tepidamans]
MHILFRERHGLEEAATAEDLGHAPADLVVMSFADSDLGAFAAGWRAGRDDLPSLRLANLARLQHPLSVDLYIEKTLAHARGILIRLLGGLDYWRYGVEQVRAAADRHGIALAVVPGDGRPDPRLDEASNVPVSTLRRLQALCDTGGARAAQGALAQLALASGLWAVPVLGVRALPRHGFHPGDFSACPVGEPAAGDAPRALVVFYRAVVAAADTAPVDALMAELRARGTTPVGVFVGSLKEPETRAWLRAQLAVIRPDVIVNATAFSARDADGGPFDAVDAPVLQVALAGSSRQAWETSDRGLSPADLAIHVVLPEVDGRVFSGVVSFKAQEPPDPDLGFARVVHAPHGERVAAVAERALALVRLRRKPRRDRRLALVLSAYPGRDDQIAHAVGLDAPESAVAVLGMLAAAGYDIDDAPIDHATLIERLLAEEIAWPLADYEAALTRLDSALRETLAAQWGAPADDPSVRDGRIRFRAIRCGSVIVAAQPERGSRAERAAEYHDARRAPRHGFVAFHLWLRQVAGIDALIHMGAHGTLEWLPGKSVALSGACWPDALLGPTPVVYPFIVNDPGEAATAKRRLGAVTIGHMTPPQRQSAVPDGLRTVERLLDEYSSADGLDPRRRERLARDIVAAARETGLDRDTGISPETPAHEAVVKLDAFVCDVKASQFSDGLHVFGRVPVVPDDAGLSADVPFEVCAGSERTSLLAALDGRAVPPGPAGSPWRGRRDVLPTGRNLFTVDPRAVPSRAAADQGQRLADALLTRHLQDHGDYPRSVVVDLWGSATMRTAGEELAMALRLIGVVPVWDHTSDRVSGFEVLTLAKLGRPRIDVTLRISGLFRDVFPGLPVLFEQAVAALAARDEPAEENPFVGRSDPRVFGPAPGAYGVGVAETVDELTPETAAAAAEAWLAGSAHAYGRNDGLFARDALEARVAAADAFVHTQDLPETDLLMAPDYAAHEAGFAAAAKTLGAAPALYHADSARAESPRMRTLPEEIARVVRARATNPHWIAGQMRHGFRGAAEIAWTLDQMALFAHLAAAVPTHHFDLYYDATLGDEAVRDFLDRANPRAAAAMRRRFRQLVAAGHWTTRRNSVMDAIADIDR